MRQRVGRVYGDRVVASNEGAAAPLATISHPTNPSPSTRICALARHILAPSSRGIARAGCGSRGARIGEAAGSVEGPPGRLHERRRRGGWAFRSLDQATARGSRGPPVAGSSDRGRGRGLAGCLRKQSGGGRGARRRWIARRRSGHGVSGAQRGRARALGTTARRGRRGGRARRREPARHRELSGHALATSRLAFAARRSAAAPEGAATATSNQEGCGSSATGRCP